MDKYVSRWMAYLVEHPLHIALGSLLFFAMFLVGLPKFGMNPSPRDYMGQELPLVQRLIKLEQEYIEDTNIYIMLMPEDGNIFTKEALSAIHFFTENAWQLPYVTRVDSLSNFQHMEVEGDDLVIESLIESADRLSDAGIIKIKDVALNEPALLDFLVSNKGHAAAVNILLNVDLGNTEKVGDVFRHLEQLKQEFKAKHPSIKLYESGHVSMVGHWLRAAYLDVKYVFSLSGLIILLGMAYFFSSFRASITVFFIGILSVLIGLGLLGLLGKVLNPASLLSTLMVLVLGLADGIHITKNVQRLLATGCSNREAIKKSVEANFMPVLLTSVTTAIGFLTFNFSGYAGVELMGNFVAFGVLVAFVLSISLLPAMLCYCGLKQEKERKNTIAELLANFVIKYKNKLLLLTIPAVFICIFCLSLIEFDERMTRYLRDDYIFTVDLDKIQDEMTGTTSIIYNFRASEPGGVNSPEFMAKVEKFVRWVRHQPDIRHVSSYLGIMKRLNKNLNAGEASFYHVPEDKDLAAQYMLLYEMSLPYGLSLTNQINFDKSAARVVLLSNDLSLKKMNELLHRNTTWLEENISEFDSFANGDAVTSMLMTQESFRTIMLSGIMALVIIGFILLITFRSFSAGILCVISVISPILVTYGLWGIFVGKIGLSGAFSMCMVIGIAVDFSVHFISKFVYARRQLACDNEASVRYAFMLVSTPVITSVVVLGGGFLMLVMSVFEYNIVMGALTSLCIFFSAASAFLLVPSLLLVEKITVK